MNFHNIVRPLITTVNPDILGTWRRSSGFTTNADGSQVPTYTDFLNVPMQVQAQTGEDLKPAVAEYVAQQGVRRDVYLYGNIQGMERPDAKGGDLLVFPETPGGTTRTWLVTTVHETWPDWCKVGVVLQVD